MDHGRAIGVLACLALVAAWGRATQADPPSRERPPGEALFGAPEVPRLLLHVDGKDVQSLRQAPRTYVPARLVVRGLAVYEQVGVKLKGAAGSFRGVDDRPALTIDMDRFSDGQRLQGLERVHLNNSVQDPTLLQEALSAELFSAAGLPAPRVGHARVWLNGRDLGLYVIKEGVDRRFLRRHFADDTGNLYDGGFCADLDQPLERDEGDGPEDRSDLLALVQACREPDLARREQRLREVLDLPTFLTYLALERMLSHWDGYSGNRNNYRVYFEPPGGKATFLPQGLDQLFGDPEYPLFAGGLGLAALSALDVPELRTLYRERLRALLPLFDMEQSLRPRVMRASAPVLRAVREFGPEVSAGWLGARADLLERLRRRAERLPVLVERVEPAPPQFDAQGEARIDGLQAQVQEGQPQVERGEHEGHAAYGIAAAPKQACIASWRRRIVLPRGRYVWQARIAVAGVVGRADPSGKGAGLRISGAPRGPGLEGTQGWTPVAFEFEVSEERRIVELVAELRALEGAAHFDADSLRLLRRP